VPCRRGRPRHAADLGRHRRPRGRGRTPPSGAAGVPRAAGAAAAERRGRRRAHRRGADPAGDDGHAGRRGRLRGRVLQRAAVQRHRPAGRRHPQPSAGAGAGPSSRFGAPGSAYRCGSPTGARTPPPRASTTSATGPSTASSSSPGSAVRACTGAPCACRTAPGPPRSALAPLASRRPGLRAPGAADPHELPVRAVLRQQISVAAGRRPGSALVAAYGRPLRTPGGGLTRLFPTADVLADAALGEPGVLESRRRTLRTLTAALAGGTVARGRPGGYAARGRLAAVACVRHAPPLEGRRRGRRTPA